MSTDTDLAPGATPSGAESMEFRCRLGTAGGDIIEGVYVAESEARLRREFEEKGLYVLAVQRAGRRGARIVPAAEAVADLRPRVPGLQPGAGDAAQGRHAARAVARHSAAARGESAVQDRARRRVRAGAGGQRAVGSLRGARHAVPGRLHGVAAGGREERQPRGGAAALRRVREGRVRRAAEDDLGAGLSGDPAAAVVRRRRDHRAEGGAGVRSFYNQFGQGAAALDADHRRDVGVCRRPTSC